MELINKLKFPNMVMFLDITTKEDKSDSNYKLVLRYTREGKRIIFTTYIGVFHKQNGETLNLRECHSLIRETTHNDIKYCHDPVTDIIYTRYFFNYLIKKIKQCKLCHLL